jgi:hypothetical protein
MSPRLSPRIARFLALQAVAVAAGLAALYLLGIWITRPNGMVETAGLDPTNAMICWIAFTGIAVALIYVHVNFARQLLSEAKGVQRGVKSW